MLLDGYKMLTDSVQFHHASAEQCKEIQQSLFHPILASFEQIINWLRLSDFGLLVLCVQLTLNILDLLIELDLEFEDGPLITLTKLCSKAKKFNNKL